MYTYQAHIVKVYDGDTVTAVNDLGFSVSIKERFRLFGIDAPEMRGEEKEFGKISRDALREMILDKTVIVKTLKDKKGKYGRYLAKIYIDDICINDWLVENGLAVYKDY